MGQMEAHLLGQAEVQRLEKEEVEAYEMQEEDDSEKLSGMTESPELPQKMTDRKKMSWHHHETSESK